MFRVTGLDHIVLRTAKPEAMIRFYTQVLNCTVERKTSPQLGLVQLRAGQSLIDIVAVDSTLGRPGGTAPGATGRNLDHFCLCLDCFDEAVIRDWLAQWGVEAGELETRYGAGGWGPSIYIHDPDGNTVELKSPAL